ncbi:PTS sugar transporter subunit IIA [Vulgatibacter incomptus]|uniref:PTS system, fructose-specific IIA component n=1 Tax=Vulgatibacter incomptus TaxID=1391653 RepID=A0A0K1PFF4_9BACT|nr:PTS sugar transporter subunit IIA [Vulgatibacter incomptus]AKU92232.1 PTS system, fructose-specific IIA component [Vulgatibacter incomptus]
MKISEFLSPDFVFSSLAGTDKRTILEELSAPMSARLAGPLAGHLPEILLEREKLGSTGIGDGVAIPHGKLRGVQQLTGVFGRSAKGVDFGAIDGKPSFLFFALFAPENSAGIHLKALARISRLFKSPALRRAILDAEDAASIYSLIVEEDEKY